MAAIHGRSVCTVALLFICGELLGAVGEAKALSGVAPDEPVKKTEVPNGRSIRGAVGLRGDGEFLSAPSLFSLFRQGRFAEAERQFAWIAEVRRGTTWGERAQYYLAECQYQQKRYVQALQTFERLHADYPASEYLEKLIEREYAIARLWLAQSDPQAPGSQKVSWTGHFDGSLPLIDTQGSALRALEHVRQNNQTGPLADDAALQIAEYYMKHNDFESASLYYDQFIAEYRKSPHVQRAQLAAIEVRCRSFIDHWWELTGPTNVREPKLLDLILALTVPLTTPISPMIVRLEAFAWLVCGKPQFWITRSRSRHPPKPDRPRQL
jgi:tetratricopeptide (TPR) repeat protein